MPNLLSYRQQFPILSESVYLINHSLGAMPMAARTRMLEYADTWATRGVRAWGEGWWEMPITVGNKIASIIGAESGSVTMHQNVSIAQAIIISCFDLHRSKRKKIVYEALNFPSVMHVYDAYAKEAGIEIIRVASDDGITIDTQKMIDAIDEQTLLVPISHVLFRSAYLQDVKPIIEKAHAVGALVVLDAYQSAGTVLMNVQELDVDFATGGSVKWLCGGPGAGWLYVNPKLVDKLEPKITGWAAHKSPFAFEPELEYAEDASRFLQGTPAIPALYAASAGYDIINEIGVERIREQSVRQTSWLIESALEEGWKINSPMNARQRGGSVIIDVPCAQEIVRELECRNFIVDFRPNAGIRIGPHFFNTDGEMAALIEEIRKINEELGDNTVNTW